MVGSLLFVNRTKQSCVGALRLIRPAGVLSAPADVLAGWCIAGATDWRTLVILSGASACLYAGGMALNDVCDSKLDAIERPDRPIPSGAITRKRAALLAALLLALGVALASMAFLPGIIALGLAAMIVLYNTIFKRSALFGPFSMGACRSLNLTLGLSVSASALGTWWPVVLLPGVYVAGVTLLARNETHEGPYRIGVVAITAGLIASLLGWGAIALFAEQADPAWMLPLLALFAVTVGSPVIHAWRQPGSETVQRAVGRAILGLVLLDAAIAAGFASPAYGGVTLALLGAATLVARRLAIT